MIALSHDSLMNHITLNFELMQRFDYSLRELETMIPWEREVYVTLLMDHLEKQAEQARKNQ